MSLLSSFTPTLFVALRFECEVDDDTIPSRAECMPSDGIPSAVDARLCDRDVAGRRFDHLPDLGGARFECCWFGLEVVVDLAKDRCSNRISWKLLLAGSVLHGLRRPKCLITAGRRPSAKRRRRVQCECFAAFNIVDPLA